MGTAVMQRMETSREAIADFCRRHHIRWLAVFGSALRDDFGPESDIDILVEFAPGARPSWADLSEIEGQLAAVLGRKVDLVEREGVIRSPNYIRRRHILNSAVPVYVER